MRRPRRSNTPAITEGQNRERGLPGAEAIRFSASSAANNRRIKAHKKTGALRCVHQARNSPVTKPDQRA